MTQNSIKNNENKDKIEENKSEIISKKKLMTTVNEQHHFHVADGMKLENLMQLMEYLEKMNIETYKFHANESKNDFSSWIKDVFEEPELAENLKTASTKENAQLIIAKKLLKELIER